MRPIERGETTETFREYQQAKSLLTTRLGNYCSFCERYIAASLAIEHMLPQTPFPELKLVWNNFLLGCVNCNSRKGTKNKTRPLSDYFWVDRDNTSRAFLYSKGGFVAVNSELEVGLQMVAKDTLKLVGLDELTWKDPEAKDNRQEQRSETWDIAEMLKQELHDEDTKLQRNRIVLFAAKVGFWSVWMTVFKDDPDMLERFIDAFAGTAKSCFDPITFQPIPRVGGAI